MHKFFHINKYFYRYFCLGLIAIALLGTQIVRANDEQFQNKLLRMDVYKTSLGGVKVNLYTTKPYKDSVIVNKKSDTEYVILMPETVSSLTSKPALKSTSDVINNIEVKTQQYGSSPGQKGYTKITFSTPKSIEITPQVQTLNVSEYQMTEKDTEELLNQAGKKQIATSIPAKPTVVIKKLTQKPAQKLTKPVTKEITQKVTKVSTQKAAKKAVPSVVQKSPPQKISPKTATVVTVPIKPAATQTVQKKITPTEQKPAAVKEVPATKETPTQQVPVAKVTQPVTPPTAQPAVSTKVSPVTSPVVGAEEKIEKFKNLLIANNDLLAMILLVLIILLLLSITIRKRKDKKQDGQNILKKEPPTPMATSTADYTENINKEMDWKEKFKAYKNQPQQLPQQPQEPAENQPEIGLESENWLEGEPTEAEPLIQDEEEAQEETSWLDFEDEEILKEASIDDLFKDEEYEEEGGFSQEQQSEEKFTQEEPSQGEWPQEEFPQEESAEEELTQDEFDFEQAFKKLNRAPSSQTGEKEGEEVTEEATSWLPVETAEDIVETSETSDEEPEEASQEDFQENLIQQELGLSKKSGYEIDASRGFYLLDFEETTALVGYINEEIFVLKRFEEPIQGAMQARLSELTSISANYIVRVGSFKALVEVTRDNMKLLIEL